ncbi:hypothetical protein [Plantibacter sp. M259]|uniref:hypothetical protein n=1 Tax=Plantibacter sp. M259 TaxID=2583822 RepID=UPI0011106666|nr:hypothetical protein [Plantibacter sp. M259]
MIGEKLRYHGVALARLIAEAGEEVTIEPLKDTSRCAYTVNNVVIFVKYSTSRLSPWKFGFSDDQRTELEELATGFTAIWIVLVCGNEGVLAVPWVDVLADLLKDKDGGAFSLQASRRKHEKFRLSGARGTPLRIAETDFPARLFV